MQQAAAQSPLERTSISRSAADAVRAMIVDGRLVDGERINEVHLAKHLGVSRTPLREALNRLAAEGALTSTPHFGYSVRPLDLDEFEQLYAMRPILDPQALRLAGLPMPARIERLERINRRLATARLPETAVECDDAWHLELLAGCPNRVLIGFIENLILRTRRYETALMRETRNILRATEDHERILVALREDNLDAACAALEHTLQSARAPIAAWLNSRQPRRRAVKK